MRLDKSKPFSVVYGEPGVRFEQGGNHYNHSGELIVRDKPTTLHLKKDKLNDVATGRSTGR